MQCRFEGTLTLDATDTRHLTPDGPLSAAVTPEGDILRIAARAVQLYAESHPRPTQVTIKQAAEMLGLSRQTVSKMLKFGQLRLNKCGLIPIELIDRARA